MKRNLIFHRRVTRLNIHSYAKGDYVLYWMQQSQRAEDNPALEFAIAKANELKLPPLVCFGLTESYPQANLRHYYFMLEGLRETQTVLAHRKIQLVIRRGAPDQVALVLAQKAAVVVCDCGYLRHQRQWRRNVAKRAPAAVFQVEGDVIVPVESVSDKSEYAARTLRPKLKRLLEDHLFNASAEKVRFPNMNLAEPGVELENLHKLCAGFELNTDVPPVTEFIKGGTSQAKKRFSLFLKEKVSRYAKHHNQPQTNDTSQMSPYLHFGQISSLYLALQVVNAGHLTPEAREAYLEQLIVRRELAMNFAHFHPAYDRYEGLPAWARQTLRDHRDDGRPVLYDLKTLEGATTHDPYWNAAMQEMRISGYMHNYMRMYWGKKILEWSPNPRQAFKSIIHLNNKYFLDGRDPNSYTGVAWIFGLHDRPWKERSIFGKVRYMAASGLERKCDIRAYMNKVEQLGLLSTTRK